MENNWRWGMTAAPLRKNKLCVIGFGVRPGRCEMMREPKCEQLSQRERSGGKERVCKRVCLLVTVYASGDPKPTDLMLLSSKSYN